MYHSSDIDSKVSSLNESYQLFHSVDCVIFGYDEKELSVLLLESDLKGYEGRWSLVGDLVRPNEGLDEACQRVLKKRSGLNDLYLEQVGTFGDPKRHPLGRVITTAFFSILRIEDYNQAIVDDHTEWFPVKKLPKMAFDHENILGSCLSQIRKSIRTLPISFHLLPDEFTMSQLQQFFEVILDMEIDKRNFRRKMKNFDYIDDTGKKEGNVSHRPAQLYKFDFTKYNEELVAGFKI